MRWFATLLLLFSSFPLYSQTARAVLRITDVQSVNLTSDSTVSSEDFQEVVREIRQYRYSSDLERRVVDTAWMAMRDRGYFKADVETVGTEVLSETSRTRTIAVTLRIREGEQYRVSSITFTGDTTFSVAQLRQALPIDDGDVMSDNKIREGQEKMRTLYASQGYMEFSAVPRMVADDTSRTVSITIDMGKGPQFTINGLTLDESPQEEVNGVAMPGREWPADKAERLRALSQSFSGSHDVTGFTNDVKKLLADMFPGYGQIDSLVAFTQGGEQRTITLNVRYPSDLP